MHTFEQIFFNIINFFQKFKPTPTPGALHRGVDKNKILTFFKILII